MKRLFPAASALLLCLVFVSALPAPAVGEEDMAPATRGQDDGRTFSTGTNFFDDAQISGGFYAFRRYRSRYSPEEGRYNPNLNHATIQANAEFVSGFLGDHIGFDLGVFGSHDVLNTRSVDHEMSFFPWSDPWHPKSGKQSTEDGFSVYKAALKAKAGPFRTRAGWFQPEGPGVLGVNWSFMPGTYRGGEAGFEHGGLSVALAWADEYKAPWYQSTNAFTKNDGETNVPWLWSSGVRYAFENGPVLELAYGSSKGHLKNAHFKSRYGLELYGGTLTFGYHLYAMDDSDDSGASENDNFDGIASQHFLFAAYAHAPWTLRLEGTWTRAPMSSEHSQGQFAYRLTDRSGSSKGAYEPWWDARSDWNAHDEKAFFFGVERSLDDILPWEGFSVGAGAAMGFDGKAWDTAEHFKEWAFTADVGYTHPDGPLKGAYAKFHYTEYRNGTGKPSWDPYRNGFQSEHDFKFMVGIPFSF